MGGALLCSALPKPSYSHLLFVLGVRLFSPKDLPDLIPEESS